MMVAWKIAPALAAGNTVVLKPSEQTPLTARAWRTGVEIFPAGVLNLVFGRGPTVGSPLVTHPKVRMVSLTGSIATGANIIASTADSVKRMHMELGGKAPVIIFDDATSTRPWKAFAPSASTTPARTAPPRAGSTRRRYLRAFVEKLGAAVAASVRPAG
jgi:aminobutyraldehyde dehydrogenase